MALDLDFSQYLNDLTPQGASTSLESFQGIPGIGSAAPMAQMPAPPSPPATNMMTSPQSSGDNEGLSIGQIIALAIEGFASGYNGRAPQGPALLMRSREFQQQKKMEDEKLQIAKEQIRSQKINHFFDFLGKFDVDEDTASKAVDAFIASNSDLKEVFGHLSGNIRIAGKDKQEVKTTTQLEAGMMKDPVTGNPLPAGTYEITARHKGGKLNVTGIKPVESSLFSRVDVEKFTPESIAEFEKTGKRSSLVPRDKADKPPNVGTDREALAQEFGFADFNTAPQEMKIKINKEVKRREDERLALQRANINIQGGQTNFKNETELRKEYLNQSKTFIEVRDSFNRVQSAAQNPSPAGDLSMIFAYMKMLDPQSVVRESEFRVAETARPLLERAGLSWDRVKSVWEGKRLTDGQRKDFLDRGQSLYASQLNSQSRTTSEFRRIAASAGLNPDQVIVDVAGEQKKGRPKILSIERVP